MIIVRSLLQSFVRVVIVLLYQKMLSIALGINGNIYEHPATYKVKTKSVAIWTTKSMRNIEIFAYVRHVFFSLSALLVQQVLFVQLAPARKNLWDFCQN